VEKTGEHDVSLSPEGPTLMKGFGDGSGAAAEPEKSWLSELIAHFNERYGTNFTNEDLLKPLNEAMADRKVQQAALVNDPEGFGYVFEPVFEEKMMDHFDTIADLGRQYFGPERDFRSSLNRSARNAAWQTLRRKAGLMDDEAA
jgi:type I restriction enzyme R subunit